MRLLSDNHPVDLTNVDLPLSFTHCWMFDGPTLDFQLRPFEYLLEAETPLITMKVCGKTVQLPQSWYVMVVDKETYKLDFVHVPSLVVSDHELYLFSRDDTKLVTTSATVSEYVKGVIQYPEIPKQNGLVIPVDYRMLHGKLVDYCMVVSPYDLFKYVDGKTIGDLQ